MFAYLVDCVLVNSGCNHGRQWHMHVYLWLSSAMEIDVLRGRGGRPFKDWPKVEWYIKFIIITWDCALTALSSTDFQTRDSGLKICLTECCQCTIPSDGDELDVCFILFRITGPLWEESTSPWWIPFTKDQQWGSLMFHLMSAWIGYRTNSWKACGMRCLDTHLTSL